MDRDYSIIAINDKKNLIHHRDAILQLFTLCFGQKMNPRLWDWAYQENPCGHAYVYLAYKDKELVGHYAMIPQKYRNKSQARTVTLSMTTMVHPAYRRAGLFNILAEAAYTQAATDGVQAVIGFPNNKSAPGFKKRLEWNCTNDYQIVKIKIYEKKEITPFHAISKKIFCDHFQAETDCLMLDFKQEDILNWRLSKPEEIYTCLAGENGELFIVKAYAKTLDVVYSNAPNIPQGLQSFAYQNGYSSLVSFPKVEDAEHTDHIETTNYLFGFRNFQAASILFTPQLIMSDIF